MYFSFSHSLPLSPAPASSTDIHPQTHVSCSEHACIHTRVCVCTCMHDHDHICVLAGRVLSARTVWVDDGWTSLSVCGLPFCCCRHKLWARMSWTRCALLSFRPWLLSGESGCMLTSSKWNSTKKKEGWQGDCQTVWTNNNKEGDFYSAYWLHMVGAQGTLQ